MNTDDNSNTENLVDMENLDKFEETFFKPSAPKPEPVVVEKAEPKPAPEESNENEDDSLATDENDTDAPTGDDDHSDEEDGSDDEEQPVQKKGKKSFQERINELTAKAREAERREQEVTRKLQDFQARSDTPEVEQKPAPTAPLREQLPADAPSPDAVDDKGEALYELGEFDPMYIKDLTKFSVQQETARMRQEMADQEQAQRVTAAQQQLADNWAQKVSAAEAEIPDLRSDIATVAAQFQNIDPGYGEYLASTVMESEVGPEIMNYLSQNIGEAQAIVASGPRAATLAIGRLEARFAKTDESTKEKSDDKLVSNAPTPPSNSSKGRGARTTTRADTDDLEAFEKLFFKT